MEIGGNKLDTKAFTMMCNQFSVILKAGVPIARTVQLIASKTSDKPLNRMLTKVGRDVEAGRSISAAFEEHGGALLPTTFIESIRAGEESGGLATSFESMSEHYTKQVQMAGKVRGALIYPAFVLVVAVVVVIVLMVFVVPEFTRTFVELGIELPWMTRALIAISNFFAKYYIVIFVTMIVIFLAYKLYGRTEDGRLNLAKLQLKLPVLGNIATLSAASQFSNTLTMMLGAGLPIVRCLSITSRVIQNYYISLEVGKMAGRIEEGRTIGDCMRESGCLPDILTDMTAVGEETGELASTLTLIAAYYDFELEQATADALAKLEPAILVVLAGVAGFIVIGMYSAMFTMYAAM